MGCPAEKSRAAQAPVSSPRSVTIRPKSVSFKESSGQRHLSMPLKKAPADDITTAATYYKEKGVGMPRSNMLSRLLHALRVAQYAEQHKLSTIDAQERLAEQAYRKTKHNLPSNTSSAPSLRMYAWLSWLIVKHCSSATGAIS